MVTNKSHVFVFHFLVCFAKSSPKLKQMKFKFSNKQVSNTKMCTHRLHVIVRNETNIKYNDLNQQKPICKNKEQLFATKKEVNNLFPRAHTLLVPEFLFCWATNSDSPDFLRPQPTHLHLRSHHHLFMSSVVKSLYLFAQFSRFWCVCWRFARTPALRLFAAEEPILRKQTHFRQSV